MKKIKAFLACSVLAFSMALAVQEVSTSSYKSNILAGINYYAQHHDVAVNWKAKAGVATRAGSVISSACMKAALIWSWSSRHHSDSWCCCSLNSITD